MHLDNSTASSGTHVGPSNSFSSDGVSDGAAASNTTAKASFPPVEPLSAQVDPVGTPPNPLRAFSLLGELDSLKERAVKAVPFLGGIAFMGQSTVIYAAPNSGKTLVSIKLLANAVAEGRVDPENAYYVNMDDSSEGLFEKGAIAEEYGFHMIAAGEHNFEPADLVDSLLKMAKDGTAKGCVVVIDTLKKFVDIMDKSRCTEFGNVVRTFTQAGGTLVALAHTNKHAGTDGKIVHAGTADILQDIDCAYVMAAARPSKGDDVLATFENIKRRGDNDQEVVYRYTSREGLSYRERFDAVTLVGEVEKAQAVTAAMMENDGPAIEIVTQCLSGKSMNKMELCKTLAPRLRLGEQKVAELLDRYCGSTQAHHLWDFKMGARGAKIFSLSTAAIAQFHPDESEY